MKFITEEDLRDLYKKEPFTTYELVPGARLTPGARQYLLDRGINMFDDVLNKGNQIQTKEKKNWKIMKLRSKLRSTQALFLVTEEELLSKDVLLAQNLIKLGKQFSAIRIAVDKKTMSENLDCQDCTGIKGTAFSEDLDDCFEITEFHMQLDKGKEILSLHSLRCALREIEPVIVEVIEDSSEDMVLYEDTIGKINQIINMLSQMICIAVGGKECQRKN